VFLSEGDLEGPEEVDGDVEDGGVGAMRMRQRMGRER
jgi:hypothetical protein